MNAWKQLAQSLDFRWVAALESTENENGRNAEMQQMPTGSVDVDLVHRVIDTEVEKPALGESTQPTTGGSQPHIPIKDTGFYGDH